MLRYSLIAIFFVLIVSILIVNLSLEKISPEGGMFQFYMILCIGFGMAMITFFVDIFTPRKSLSSLAGLFFGLLVGVIISWGMSFVLEMINNLYKIGLTDNGLAAVTWIMGICICYLTISVVMRTKDDIRFVIPYVEFAKQTKGARPLVLDTSAIIDGRIADLYHSKLLDAPVVVPRFVLNELQLISDSADRLKRQRGRRGLDILKTMQENSGIDIEIDDTPVPESEDVKGVDQKLVLFTKTCNGRLATTDYNLSKVAQVREVDVFNINDLANALKAIALPGENMEIRIIKPGEESDQGIGYLDDGTMVVVENGRDKIGRQVAISITSSLQTSAGKMIFGKFEGFAGNGGNR